MALYFASLNSGSNGNCYYVGNEQEAVLVDAGISCREIRTRMGRLGLSLSSVRGIFISHEHSDHTRGAEVLSRRHGIPVFITGPAKEDGGLEIPDELLVRITPGEEITMGELRILPFAKRHDTRDPVSFTVSSNGLTVGVMTDIGSVCEEVAKQFSRCSAVFLESNYDEEMLVNGSYPWYLKQRIKGDYGHLSNDQSLELFVSHRSPGLTHLLLSHLSKENNTPEKALDKFRPHSEGIHLAIASRYGETEVFRIGQPVWTLF